MGKKKLKIGEAVVETGAKMIAPISLFLSLHREAAKKNPEMFKGLHSGVRIIHNN